MDKSAIAILFAAVFAVSFAVSKYQSTQKISNREYYQNNFLASDYSGGNWVSRPNFRADLSPKFDAERVGGGNITGEFPGMSVQGAGVTPVESLMDLSTNPSYAAMGGPNAAYSDPRLSGGLSTNQVNEILSQKLSFPACSEGPIFLWLRPSIWRNNSPPSYDRDAPLAFTEALL